MAKRSEEIVTGRRNVLEAIRSGKVYKLMVLKNARGKVTEIIEEARTKGIPVEKWDRSNFDALATTCDKDNSHQGVAALVEGYSYLPWDQLIEEKKNTSKFELILLLDHLQDPHNLGALLRTAEASGVKNLIIPKDRSVQVNATVRKVAAGAAEWVNVSRVTNINKAIKELKEIGFWIYGASVNGVVPYYQVDWQRKVGLILGSEGKGISRLAEKNCDELIYLPMVGQLNSINVSVSGGLLMYEFRRHLEGW